METVMFANHNKKVSQS